MRRFGAANRRPRGGAAARPLLIACLLPLVNIVLNIALIAVIYIGSFDVQAGMVGPGTVMAALTYIVLILGGILMFAMISHQIFARHDVEAQAGRSSGDAARYRGWRRGEQSRRPRQDCCHRALPCLVLPSRPAGERIDRYLPCRGTQ